MDRLIIKIMLMAVFGVFMVNTIPVAVGLMAGNTITGNSLVEMFILVAVPIGTVFIGIYKVISIASG